MSYLFIYLFIYLFMSYELIITAITVNSDDFFLPQIKLSVLDPKIGNCFRKMWGGFFFFPFSSVNCKFH